MKRVILLEEIVLCFQTLRPQLLELLQGESNSRPLTPETEVIEISDELELPKTVSSGNLPKSEISKSDTSKSDPQAVQCPVCSESMTADYLQRCHLDDCLSGKAKPVPAKRKRNEIALFFQRKRVAKKETDHENFYFEQAEKHHHDTKKLPKIDFGSVSTPKLKEKLTSLKLSSLGTRPQLELRYNHYYILHNSNLDSSRPVTDLVLRQKLNQWEKSHLAFTAPVGTNNLFGDSLSHKSLTDKDFPVGAYLEKYKDEFKELVKAARKSAKKKNAEASDKTDDPANKEVLPKHASPTAEPMQIPPPAPPAPHALPDVSIADTGPRSDEPFDFSKSTLFTQQ